MRYFVHRFWTIDETKAFLSISTIEISELEFLQKNRKRFGVDLIGPLPQTTQGNKYYCDSIIFFFRSGLKLQPCQIKQL